VRQAAAASDVFIAVAAVADYKVKNRAAQKIKKGAGGMTLELTENPDILAQVAAMKNPPFCVGFAAESEKLAENARGGARRFVRELGDGAERIEEKMRLKLGVEILHARARELPLERARDAPALAEGPALVERIGDEHDRHVAHRNEIGVVEKRGGEGNGIGHPGRAHHRAPDHRVRQRGEQDGRHVGDESRERAGDTPPNQPVPAGDGRTERGPHKGEREVEPRDQPPVVAHGRHGLGQDDLEQAEGEPRGQRECGDAEPGSAVG